MNTSEEDGMLRMSFLEHLEELRRRLLYALGGIGVAFILSLTYSNQLWSVIRRPAVTALLSLGYPTAEAKLTVLTPGEGFAIVWVKLPMLAAIFLASPWVLYQVWSFIQPGLYRQEKRWARPFILCSAGLFAAGGLFAYFVAFPYSLTFLLGISREIDSRPLVSVSDYFDMFVNVIFGVSLVFELPVVIFLLTLLRLASPRFLLRHARYAILAIAVFAAVVTPTQDIINLMIFTVPMWALFFLGVLAAYILDARRDGIPLPWRKICLIGGPVLLGSAGLYLAGRKKGWFHR